MWVLLFYGIASLNRTFILLQDPILWTTLAAFALSASDLDTAELCLAAIEEVEKLRYIQHIRRIPSQVCEGGLCSHGCFYTFSWFISQILFEMQVLRSGRSSGGPGDLSASFWAGRIYSTVVSTTVTLEGHRNESITASIRTVWISLLQCFWMCIFVSANFIFRFRRVICVHLLFHIYILCSFLF